MGLEHKPWKGKIDRERSRSDAGEGASGPASSGGRSQGEPGRYVSRARVIEQTNISSVEEFERIAEHLAQRGFITEGVNDYEFFVLTLEGIAEGIEY